MLSVVPFKPVKGEAFRVRFRIFLTDISVTNYDTTINFRSTEHNNTPYLQHNLAYASSFPLNKGVSNISSWKCAISKDDGAFALPTNTPVQIAIGNADVTYNNGWYYLDLTATEMNADTILLVLTDGVINHVGATMMIQTGAAASGGSGVTAQEVWEYETRSLTEPVAVTGDVVIGDVDTDEIARKVRQKLMPFILG